MHGNQDFCVLLSLGTTSFVMQIEPIAYFRSPFDGKFGIPRQSGLVENLTGEIVFVNEWRQPEALRGLADFDYIWLLWGFSENVAAKKSATVRPPLLGGNQRMGVFATRSPFRPNNLGLSSVRLADIESTAEGPIIKVLGADLMNGTPIFDIKPYLPYVDCHPKARGGFVDEHRWKKLHVVVPDGLKNALSPAELSTLVDALEWDPRPKYQDNPARIYGMTFAGHDIHFRVAGETLEILPTE